MQNSGNSELYGKLALELNKMKKGVKTHVQAHLYNYLKVPKTVFFKSCQVYLKDEEKKPIYDEAMKVIRDENSTFVPTEMDKAAVLDAIKFIEEKRVANYETMLKMIKEKP